jgi:haloalkane dehalogenase
MNDTAINAPAAGRRVVGSRDEYLSPAVAARLDSLFARGTVRLVDDASHWPQQDQPAAVAKVIKKAAAPAATGRSA